MIGSLFTLAGETLSAIGRMIERPAFNDDAAEEYLSESAVINKVTFDTLQATREHDLHWSGGRNGRMESDGPDAADVLADFEARTEVHEPKFCQHCNSYGIHLRSCSTSPGASPVSQPAAAAVPGESVGATESSSGGGADRPLSEVLGEAATLLDRLATRAHASLSDVVTLSYVNDALMLAPELRDIAAQLRDTE